MSEWKEVRLGDVSTLSTGFPFDGHKYSKNGIRVVRGDNVTIGSLRWDTEKDKRWNETFDRREEYSLKEGDIVIGMDGSRVGKNRAQVKGDDLPLLLAQRVACVRNNQLSCQKFLYYHIFNNTFEKYIAHVCTGTSIPHISLKQISDFRITIPDLPTQQRIASILSSLDAKIENNNKINAKLEEIAQNLFKEWFVDFGPFKNGKFVESELGLIPEGWRVGTLGEVCTKITDGSHFSPQNSDKDNIPMLSVKDMEEYGFNYKSCKHISKEDYLKLKDGDCVPLVDDILVAKDGSYLKEIFICDEFKEQAILSSIAIFRPKREIVFPDYLLGILKSPKVMKDVKENYVSGSAVPRIVLKDFKKLPILVPTYTVQSEFTDIYNSCRKQIYNNCKENQRLATLRETLLPKLMSGEIEV